MKLCKPTFQPFTTPTDFHEQFTLSIPLTSPTHEIPTLLFTLFFVTQKRVIAMVLFQMSLRVQCGCWFCGGTTTHFNYSRSKVCCDTELRVAVQRWVRPSALCAGVVVRCVCWFGLFGYFGCPDRRATTDERKHARTPGRDPGNHRCFGKCRSLHLVVVLCSLCRGFLTSWRVIFCVGSLLLILPNRFIE